MEAAFVLGIELVSLLLEFSLHSSNSHPLFKALKWAFGDISGFPVLACLLG
jgi:hypothetical protein